MDTLAECIKEALDGNFDPLKDFYFKVGRREELNVVELERKDEE